MKKLFFSILSLSLFVTSSVYALEVKNIAGGALKSTASAVKTTATSADTTTIRKSINIMNSKLALADKDVQAAFTSLVTALSSKEEAAKIRAEIKAINTNANLNTVEKSAKLSQIMSDYGVSLKKADEDLKTRLQTASSEKTTQIISALDKLSDASLTYMDLTNDVQSIINQFTANPMLATSMKGDFTELKNTSKMIKSNLKSLKDVTTGAVNLCKTCGIKIAKTTTKTSKTKKIDFTKLSK